ncbi:histidinol-phosphatase HisJ [Paenibacillus mucilaginosus]|uniref:Histidinol-phosphatase n=3 Tax=Paenibacillus mucilaginosus TaxID=61624 RepID=H6NTL7_9BACL|nr:histidinol-phosphatase HisJ [Paenibacillus mucilaginosus]AEI38843.1 histidinol phosphate phosphatase HisJ family [Paenibacillus mucilaginosus KNP414]AFC27164.1 histidinol phosphate phosphatase HisJ family [Paenibacillus mucilaginosus 3016]AFH59305.1 histidinol phosphatase [Paenibacillus mucilaginosus K02]MCG7217330.1 histidinol-phosphatase HisJ [Paenibacillus mucilaginosus]WDM27914.1 histidinol-phosphatase HisJ [Paenibacillus mucilaginosus]
MRIDYHTHHVRCGHASGDLEEYVVKGIEIGLTQLGLSDHMPLLHVDPETYLPGMAMPMDELPRYVEEAFRLQQKYKDQIDIRVGLEGDYIEGWEKQIEEIIRAYPWDYVIGSVHFLGEWDITDYRQTDGWKERDAYAVYEQYYDAVVKACRTGFYDYIGHIDVIKRFGFKPDRNVEHLENMALEAVKAANMAIELNASGLRMPVQEMFPSRRMLEYALKLGIPVTLGSDAHQPERLAQYLDEASALLQDVGFTDLATFKVRNRQNVPIGFE